MCTVLYIPVDQGFRFFTLRDENPLLAKAQPPSLSSGPAHAFLAPLVANNRGTWMGVNEQGDAVFLLNGGKENHVKAPHHDSSRGRVVVDMLRSKWPIMEWIMMDLSRTEPFTLVVFSEKHLFELVWDGRIKHKSILSQDQPAIWSSVTLYDKAAQKERENHFGDWLSHHPQVTNETVLRFFASWPDTQNGFFMNRGKDLKTMSFASVQAHADQGATIDYLDFSTGQFFPSSISFSPPATAPACVLSMA